MTSLPPRGYMGLDILAVLELEDRSRIKLEGVLEDIIIKIDFWRYPTKFLILQKKSNLGGHPLILGRPVGHCICIYRMQIWIYDDLIWLGYKET